MTRPDARFLKKFRIQETPSGLVNGSNVTFTLSQTPHESDGVNVYIDGLKQRYTTDYSVSGVTITMVTAPAVAQTIYVEYDMNTGEN